MPLTPVQRAILVDLLVYGDDKAENIGNRTGFHRNSVSRSMKRKPREWMQLPIDDRILETLGESQLILSPSVIAMNINKSREEVSRRLSVLVDKDVVNRVQRGYYEITEKGMNCSLR